MIAIRQKPTLAAMPMPSILQARKPCGCVSAACLASYIGAEHFRRQYEREGCVVTLVAQTDPSFTRLGGCPHRSKPKKPEAVEW